MEKWQWAWLAGIFDGEGNIEFTNRASVRLRVAMTDLDIIEELDRLSPSPRGIAERHPPNRKVQYVWERQDRDEVRHFLEGVLPFLYARRSARARAALERLKLNNGAKPKRTHCIRGHPLSGDNLYLITATGARSCRTCRRNRDLQRTEERRLARAA